MDINKILTSNTVFADDSIRTDQFVFSSSHEYEDIRSWIDACDDYIISVSPVRHRVNGLYSITVVWFDSSVWHPTASN